MERLGPEIISLIVDRVWRRYYKTCATISRAFQHEVERRTFRSLELYSAEDIAVLSRLLSRFPGRRFYLREIKLASLPQTMPSGRFSQHPLTFRKDVAALLAALHRCDEEDERAGVPTDPMICLVLRPGWGSRVPMDEADEGILGLDQVHVPSACLPAFPEWTLLEDPSPPPLPSSRRVRELRVENAGVHPIAVAQFASAMPQLETLYFFCYDPAIGRHQARLAQRDALARALNSLCGKLPRLKDLEIHRIEYHSVSNHSLACQRLVDAEGIDLVCEAVRKLAQPTVEKLCLSNWLISADLFLDKRDPSAVKTWPRLEDLDVSSSVMAPNGKWYVTGQPSDEPFDPAPHPDDTLRFMANMDAKAGMGTEPAGAGTARENGADMHHRWRLHVDSNMMDPLLESLTEAVTQHMPKRREVKFLIGGPSQDNRNGPRGPSLAVLYDERFEDDQRLWNVQRKGNFREWRIPQSLRDAWQYLLIQDFEMKPEPGTEVQDEVMDSSADEDEVDAGGDMSSDSEMN
ncbi:hypothetical protein PG991_001206 [Apiospora marii]|uniref:F-box domain-containing protein n=1 Tax=Apiospora marii TaxID=335849 RepID=A0ABR1SU52_9PEZI